MTLSNQNIQDLYKFTRQHYVEFYDVQTELVDHLANDIEEIWGEKPHLTFEQALDISFKKFGVYGFLNVVEQKQRQVGKRYHKILWGFAKEWFKLPKILAAMVVFLFFYYCLQFKTGIFILGVVITILVVLDLYCVTLINSEAKKRFKKNGKKWMLEEYIFNVASFGSIMAGSILPQFLIFSLKELPSYWMSVLVSFLITIAVIYSYVALVIIPAKAEELLREMYPEYKIASSL